ncbi:transposase [Niabella sp.]|uniref:transposase n=1 Tax=Niabella sp. TaxID=1962976 RepID=UPI0026199520|nr:transposase [Niabella sp.]
MKVGEIFFWTATINNWQRLLEQDSYKNIIIDSLRHLSDTRKIDVFAFVIMPTHIHLIWRTNALNGKETAQGSLLKFTAHEFKKWIRTDQGIPLSSYKVSAINKQYEFWQRDPLAIHLYTKKVAYQKLDYIHYNPCQAHWKLVTDPCDYVYSSAGFYEKNENRFPFLKDLREEFG